MDSQRRLSWNKMFENILLAVQFSAQENIGFLADFTLGEK